MIFSIILVILSAIWSLILYYQIPTKFGGMGGWIVAILMGITLLIEELQKCM